MKIVKYFFIAFMLLVFFLAGMVTQRFYGLVNILKLINQNLFGQYDIEYINEDHAGELSIYIFAGQSNMAGVGKVFEYKPLKTNDQIYVFNENYEWIKGTEPVKKYIGPTISFGATIIDNNPEEKIGLLNVASGGKY